jgi:uncharacterized membrane protein (DUF2068 family)
MGQRGRKAGKPGKKSSKVGIRSVAAFEGAKGLLVLLTGFGLLAFVHKDLHLAAEELVRHLHLNPARHYPQIFIQTASHVSNSQMLGLALAAMAYSVIRFVEAAGLWFRRSWAEWFGLLTGAVYLPVEIVAALRHPAWPRVTVFIVNTFVVGYLCCVVVAGRKKR